MSNLYPSQRVSKALKRFKRRHPKNYDLIETFAMDLLAQGISELRVTGYLTYLSNILKVVNKDFREYTRDNVRKVIAHYQTRANRGEISPNTVFEVRKTLKRFFKWLGKEDLVNWFVAGKCKFNLSPQDLITHEEFEAMLKACQNSRDRAMLSLLYETGARIREISAMMIKDVIFDDYGAVIWFPRSKTQRRNLRVIFSTKYLAEWLSDHPSANDPEALLWIKLSHKNYLKPLEYKDIQLQLKKIAKRAGIKEEDLRPPLQTHPGDEITTAGVRSGGSEIHGLGSGNEDDQDIRTLGRPGRREGHSGDARNKARRGGRKHQGAAVSALLVCQSWKRKVLFPLRLTADRRHRQGNREVGGEEGKAARSHDQVGNTSADHEPAGRNREA